MERATVILVSHPLRTMPDVSSLVIVGAGGLGREVAALIEATNDHRPTWTLEGFVDDDPALSGESVMGYPVLGDVSWLSQQGECSFAIAIGDADVRRQISAVLAPSPVAPTRIIPSSVAVHHSTQVDPGSILCKGAAPTVDVQIGRYTILDQHVTVGHDAVLDSFVTVHPGANISGSVELRTGVHVGAGAVVLPNTTIGARATVGAGAVVTDDIPSGCTVAGVPARPV